MMQQRRVWLGALVIFIVLLVGALVWFYYPQVSNLTNEYTTAAVIRDLDVFVTKNPGAWPTSWQELGDGSDRSECTHFRFDITVAELLARRELIYEVIRPVTGKYLTYPHAKEQLDEVFGKLKESDTERKNCLMKGKTKPQAVCESQRLLLERHESKQMTSTRIPRIGANSWNPRQGFVPSDWCVLVSIRG